MFNFNVRVYGILINSNNEILLSDEYEYEFAHTKFPGGGLELGEGTRECLVREFMEECNLKIEVLDHFYTTDFYQKSAFNNTQIISIYYFVKALEEFNFKVSDKVFDFEFTGTQQSFRWIKCSDINEDSVTLPIDKVVAKLLQSKYN